MRGGLPFYLATSTNGIGHVVQRFSQDSALPSAYSFNDAQQTALMTIEATRCTLRSPPTNTRPPESSPSRYDGKPNARCGPCTRDARTSQRSAGVRASSVRTGPQGPHSTEGGSTTPSRCLTLVCGPSKSGTHPPSHRLYRDAPRDSVCCSAASFGGWRDAGDPRRRRCHAGG